MNFEESLNYLFGLGNETLTMKLGLKTVGTLARACGDPQKQFPAVHIAGTNGKGSTAAMTEAILRSAGYRTGLFTSPHLVSVTERIRICGEHAAEADFASAASVVRETSERLVAEGELEAVPTFFEQITMIAFMIFAEKKIEIATLEVGMGGRLDATNICEPLVTAITPVSYDHQKYLGSELGEIAGEKAGIIKSNVPVVVAPQEPDAMNAIISKASEMSAPLIKSDALPASSLSDGRYRFEYQNNEISLNLRGKHQAVNALTAIKIVEQLIDQGWAISPRAIIEGLKNADWPGRLQMFETAGAPVLLDGAHNPAGIEALLEFLQEHFSTRPITLIFGAMRDKSIGNMIRTIAPAAEKVIFAKIHSPRAAKPGQIAETINIQSIRADSVDEALKEALRITPKNGLIVACGSLYLIGEMIRALK